MNELQDLSHRRIRLILNAIRSPAAWTCDLTKDRWRPTVSKMIRLIAKRKSQEVTSRPTH